MDLYTEDFREVRTSHQVSLTPPPSKTYNNLIYVHKRVKFLTLELMALAWVIYMFKQQLLGIRRK